MRTLLYGTKGTIEMDNQSPQITLYKAFKYGGAGKTKYLPQQIPVVVNNHNMASEIQDMMDAIINNLPIETDALEGANTVAVCQAAVRSAAQGKPVVPEYFE
jgi:predicted dehydrogenase